MFENLKSGFFDGLTSVQNAITNRRNALNSNSFQHKHINEGELRDIYKSGIGSKVVRIKAGYSLNKTIQFESQGNEEYYNKNLRKEVKRAAKFMVGFGRGIIVNYYRGDDLDKPLRIQKGRRLKVRTFSGDEVNVSDIERSFHSDRYYKPKEYMVNGHTIHHSRVIDFTYVEPPEDDITDYDYGGISEFEMVYNQLVSDGIVERAAANIVEKNSSLFYKLKGFKDALQRKQGDSMEEYFSKVEDFRSVNGATLMDMDDSVEVHSQSLSNLGEVSDISLRRLAMVTGIPLSMLVGENVKGLNSTGDNERLVFQDMVETLQSDYLLEPLQLLFDLHELGKVAFKENQGDSPQARVIYEKEAIGNALILFQMGEDHGAYLEDRGIIQKESYDKFFEAE